MSQPQPITDVTGGTMSPSLDILFPDDIGIFYSCIMMREVRDGMSSNVESCVGRSRPQSDSFAMDIVCSLSAWI